MTRFLTFAFLFLAFYLPFQPQMTFAQDDEDVFPTVLASEGLVIAGTQSVPYWSKNTPLNAPAAEPGELFIFNALTPRKENGDPLPFRVAIYAYAQGENDSKPKPIPVRADIDVEKRYSTKRPGGGLMVSSQIIGTCDSVSLFLPHSVYDLPPGMYEISFHIASFVEQSGKTVTEEYEIGAGFYVEVTPGEKVNRGKGPTRVIHQTMFETSEELGWVYAQPYKLQKIKK